MTQNQPAVSSQVPMLPDVRWAAPWTLEGLSNPLPWFATMAAEHPMVYDERADLWHFFGHSLVVEFLRAPADWSIAKRLEKVPPDERPIRLLTTDPPEHLELKGHFAHAYRPRRVASLEERIRTVCRALLADCAEKGRFEAMSEFAYPLTSDMICQIMGVPPRDSAAILDAATTVAYHGAIPGPGEPPKVYMGAAKPGANKNSAYFADLVRLRRTDPRDDLVTDLAQVPDGKLIGKLNVCSLLNEQLDAGQSTTTHLIGSMLLYLDRNRAQWERVRADPSLVPQVVEEALRYATPVQARPRVNTHDLEVHGVTIPEGSTGVAWTQAANVDRSVFDDPLRFDILRNPNHHVTFGFGEHFCLGSSLARMEAKVALEEWIARFDDFHCVDDEPKWKHDFIVRGLSQLDVEVRPR